MKTAFTFILSFFLLPVFAQTQNGNWNGSPNGDHSMVMCKISGTVKDSLTNLPIEFATVVVLKSKDSLMVNGMVTDENGNFSIDQLNPGFYFIKVGYIGYQEKKLNGIKLKPENPNQVLPTIYLMPDHIELENITVEDNSDAIQNTIDKKIFNVDKNLTTQGGSALDVLNNIPSVSVDLDGNLTLRGNGNVTVLIDGKPSSLTGNGNSLLAQVPASTIESVELITNPSAKYDPTGTSGIINIVLKKNHKNGLNGAVTAGVGTGNKYNTSANINYRSGKWNLFANYGYTYNTRSGFGNIQRNYLVGDSTYYFTQINNNDKVNSSNLLKGGIDFTINDHNSCTLSSTFNPGTENKDEIFVYNYFDNHHLLSLASNRSAINENTNSNLDISFDYSHKFSKPKEELTFNATRSEMKNPGSNQYNQVYFDTLGIVRTDTLINTNQESNSMFKSLNLQTDFVDPFKKGKLETGIKFSHRMMDNSLYSETLDVLENVFKPDSGINNEFVFNENVLAAYLVVTKTILSFTYQAGLRAEQTFTEPHLINTDSVYHNQYFSLFPSAAIMHNLNESLNLKVSYSRRINRPMVMNLNPFPEYSDPTSIRVGNPYLKPEYVDALEFSVNKISKNYSASTTIYYRQTNNAFFRYVTVNDSGMAMVQFTNLKTSNAYGFEFNTKWDVTKDWNLSANTNLFRNEVDASNVVAGLTNGNLSFSIRFNSNLALPKNILIQLTGNYRSPMVTAQGQMDASYNVDCGLKKDVMKKKGTLSLSVSDIFNTMQMGIHVSTATFESQMIRKRESRVANLSFTYRFGVQEKNQKPQDKMQQQNYQNQDMGF